MFDKRVLILHVTTALRRRQSSGKINVKIEGARAPGPRGCDVTGCVKLAVCEALLTLNAFYMCQPHSQPVYDVYVSNH